MKVLPLLASAAALVAFSMPASAQDADAANKALKDSGCTKCHSVDKSKKGPSFQKVSGKYKGKADAEAKLTEFLAKGGKVKMDGADEDHPPLKDAGKAPTVVKFILAQ